MSFLSDVLNGIGRVAGSLVRAVGSIPQRVLGTRLLEIASTVAAAIPGLHLPGIIGRALTVLDSARDVQTFLREGRDTFGALVAAHGLDGTVLNGLASEVPPLGDIVAGEDRALCSVAEWLREQGDAVVARMQNLMVTVSEWLNRLTGVLQVADAVLPIDGSQWVTQIASAGVRVNAWISRLADVRARMRDIAGMLEETCKVMHYRPFGSSTRNLMLR